MDNTEFTTIKATINNSGITKNEMIILGVLLLIACLLIIAIGQKILEPPPGIPIVHNSIIASAIRHQAKGFGSESIIFSIEQFNKISVTLPNNLGDYAEWSPDGQWIVFSRRESIGGGISESKIYVMRTDGSQQTRVPLPDGGVHPTWSPDGKQIAFYRPRRWQEDGPVSGAGTYVTNIECLLRGESCTLELRLLVEQPDSYKISSPDWSPDGRQIVYAGTNHISVINVDGQSQAIDLTPYFSGVSKEPQWSPDGTKIVAMCYGEISSVGICVMNRDGSNLVYLTRETTFRNTHQPRWSPDGRKIAYISEVSNEPIPQSCINPDGCGRGIYASSVFIINADGSGITRLPFEDDLVIEWFYWYP